MNRKTIALSGGFDPVHVGHVKMIEDASRQGQVIKLGCVAASKKRLCFHDLERKSTYNG